MFDELTREGPHSDSYHTCPGAYFGGATLALRLRARKFNLSLFLARGPSYRGNEFSLPAADEKMSEWAARVDVVRIVNRSIQDTSLKLQLLAGMDQLYKRGIW